MSEPARRAIQQAPSQDHHPAPLSPIERRVQALEDLLREQGVVDDDFIDGVVQTYADDLGPMSGAKVEIRVWDSSADVRYLVLPERPEGSGGLDEEELVQLVTRDSMIGVARL